LRRNPTRFSVIFEDVICGSKIMILKMTPEELVGRYIQGERDFRGIIVIQSPLDVKGSEIDFRGLCLQNINLSGACLKKADFTGADYLCRNTFYKEQKIAVISCLKNITITEIRNLTYHSPTLINNLLSKQHTYLPQE
jgi:hypothetical protein